MKESSVTAKSNSDLDSVTPGHKEDGKRERGYTVSDTLSRAGARRPCLYTGEAPLAAPCPSLCATRATLADAKQRKEKCQKKEHKLGRLFGRQIVAGHARTSVLLHTADDYY